MTEVVASTQQDVGAAMGRLLSDFGAAAGLVLVSVGEQTGLWQALSAGRATVAEVAGASGVAEPHARAWLFAMTAAGYLTHDAATGRFDLAPGFDVPMAGPLSGLVEGTCAQLAAWWGLLDRYASAYRAGTGIAWGELPARHADAMDQISRTVVVPDLVGSWLPAVPGLAARLAGGGRVADVGCGYGAAAIAIAQAFPAARCTGIDSDDASIARARVAASREGVADRVTFEVTAATELAGGPYDLVLYSDSLHDFGRPQAALARARNQLTDDGVVLLVEHAGSDRLADNLDPVGRFFYACSALVCTPNALADHPEGTPLGSVPGEGRLRELASAAGFGAVRRLETDAPMNILLELRR